MPIFFTPIFIKFLKVSLLFIKDYLKVNESFYYVLSIG